MVFLKVDGDLEIFFWLIPQELTFQYNFQVLM